MFTSTRVSQLLTCTDNRACKAGLCQDYGFYDNTTSSTSIWLNDEYFDRVGDFGTGSTINDTITLGGHTVPALEFGVLQSFSGFFDSMHQNAGIFGLGAFCDTPACRGYPTTLQQLADAHLIPRRAFGLYLGANTLAATGQLLLGGADKAKQDGPLHVLAMKPNQSGQPNNVHVVAVTLTKADGTNVTATIPEDRQSDTTWDSGNPAWALPTAVFDAAMAALGNAEKKELAYGLEVDCKYRDAAAGDAIVATLEGDVEAVVTLDRVVGEYDDSRCITYLENGGTGVGFGAEFLRNMYSVFDYDAMTISFSKVKYTDATDIHKL